MAIRRIWLHKPDVNSCVWYAHFVQFIFVRQSHCAYFEEGVIGGVSNGKVYLLCTCRVAQKPKRVQNRQ